MALSIVWTPNAIAGFDEIIDYLEANWTEKEIAAFMRQTQEFFELLARHPYLLERSDKLKNVHRGPMNRHTIITYMVDPKKQLIVLIDLRASKKMR